MAARWAFSFSAVVLPHSRQRQEQDEHGAAYIQRWVFVYSSNGGGVGFKVEHLHIVPFVSLDAVHEVVRDGAGVSGIIADDLQVVVV